jgi:hypothetical protein
MLGIFLFTTLFCFARLNASIEAGGGFARFSDLNAFWIAQQAADPLILHKVLAWACAWGFGVAMIGCGWMSILGLRWSYHALLRTMKA